jgi:hypothetical protein
MIARGRWHASQLAYFLDRLRSIPEGEGSLLDSTLIVWGNEVADGTIHSHVDMPFLLAGSAGGRLSTGRYLEYSSASHTQLLVSILNAMDVEAQSFGLDEFNDGPLAGLTG